MQLGCLIETRRGSRLPVIESHLDYSGASALLRYCLYRQGGEADGDNMLLDESFDYIDDATSLVSKESVIVKIKETNKFSGMEEYLSLNARFRWVGASRC